ncbi:MAG: molybdopterin-dependent oxidoreductase [Candidatus Hodarchaeota archaeon]
MFISIQIKRIKSLILITIILIALENYLITFNAARANNDSPITPNDEFFEVAIDFFDINPEEYRLVVIGAVTNPLTLSLDEIKAMPVTSEIVRLTCVGYRPRVNNLTGVANFTGVKLSYILNLAEIDLEKAKDISFHTPDPEGYSTSLNTTEAFWEDVILAYEMNGVPLPKNQGFPLRIVCPRMFGYKWIKWIASINVTTFDYKGYWESLGFDDSPYVDIDLPIYYTLTSGNDTRRISWLGLEIFLPALITLTLFQLQQKKKRLQ